MHNKQNLLLRPNATGRVSFRGTPGGKLTIRITTRRGPNLGDSEPIGPIPGEQNPNPISTLKSRRALPLKTSKVLSRNSNLGGKRATKLREKLLDAELQFTATVPNANDTDVSFLVKNPNRSPILSFNSIGGLVVLSDLNPNPPTILQPPIQVQVKVRNGAIFHDEVTHPDPNGHPGPLTISPNHIFVGHDIIDVVFTNPNNFPVLFNTFINVQNDLTMSSTILPSSMVGRLFEDALLVIASSFGIRNGKLFFAFAKEIADELGNNHDPIDLDMNDLDVTLEIKPFLFELLSNEETIRYIERWHLSNYREKDSYLCFKCV